jgi:hypothetical protein
MPRLSKAAKAAIEAGEQEVERAGAVSKQPRLDKRAAYSGLMRWLRVVDMDAPRGAEIQGPTRDAWLRDIWKKEPHLAGVVNSVTLIDSNRGWELIGGRNQVSRYTDILHNVDGGQGWRQFMRRSSLSYWCTDLGAVTEIGREGKAGPMRDLWHVDSARCRMTGKFDNPLDYTPSTGGLQHWAAEDFWRICSLPSDDEAALGLGFCAISRIIETLRLLYAVLVHDQEQVAARAPKGLLLIQGITQNQWDEAMATREEQLASKELQYYGALEVLASAGADQVDAKLIALSQLPENFDAKTFIDLAMYTFALAFGYDPSEFWPVQFGALGRGTETEVQHAKASGKGGVDFALSWQEGLQRILPETLHWEFEQRDDQGEMLMEGVKQAKLATVTEAYNAGIVQGVPIISRQEARTLLAEAGIIPTEWTEAEEDVTATDTEDAETEDAAPTEESPVQAPVTTPPAVAPTSPAVQQALESRQVQRAMAIWPREPIVRYAYHNGKGTLRTIWQPGRHVWQGVTRAADDILYKSGDVVITSKDVDKAISEAKKRVPAMADLLTATVEKA